MSKIPIEAKTLNGVSFDNMIKSFLAKVLEAEGFDYCWPNHDNKYSGKGYRESAFPNTRDCSGTVTAAVYELTGLDIRSTHNAQRLHDETERLLVPEDGALVFYGKSSKEVTHVMVYMPGGRVFGASGGNSTTTSPEVAKKMHANVRYQTGPNYRKDLVGFGRLFKK